MAIEMNINSADDIFRTVTFDNAAWSSMEHADSEILFAPSTEEDDLEEEDEEDFDDDDKEDDDDEDEDDEEEGEDEYDDEADEIDDEDEDDDEEDHGLITSPEESERL